MVLTAHIQMPLTRYILFNKKINAVRASRSYSIFYIADMVSFFVICFISKIIVVIPLTHHKKTAINYPFVYRIFSRCAKVMVIKII